MFLTSPHRTKIIDKPFHELILGSILENAKKNPSKFALIDSKGERKFTYQDVYNLSYVLAGSIHQIGVRKGDKVMICLPNCIEYPLITLGIALRGGIISGINPVYTKFEIERQMKDSEAKFVCTIDFLLPNIIGAAKKLGNQIKKIIAIKTLEGKQLPKGVTNFDDLISTRRDSYLPEVHFDTKRDLFSLPYSSGTTGPPKGVMITHYNMTAMAQMYQKHFEEFAKVTAGNYNQESETNVAFLPFFHAYGFGILLYNLRLGITTVPVPKFYLENYLELVQRYKPRLLYLVPPVAVLLAKHPVVSKYDISSVRYTISGAAPLGANVCEDLKKRHPYLKGVLQAYGMTETTIMTHMPWPDAPMGSVGMLVTNMDLKIVDSETKRVLGPNETGEVFVRGHNITIGYFRRPDATADTIDSDDWLHTGDIGYFDKNGYLYVVDRLKELIKVKGFQVPPAELEDLLLDHPAIQDCAVVGVPDADVGELPRAYVVVKEGTNVSATEIQNFVKDKVAHYKRLKGGVEFVQEIPKNPSGKILRRLIRDKMTKLNSKL